MSANANTDPRLEGMEIRYGGRTLEVRVYVNTDEDPLEIARRVEEAARGDKENMAVSQVGECQEAAAKKLWELVFEQARAQAAQRASAAVAQASEKKE